MTKKQMDDVVPPEKRSIRDIPLPKSRSHQSNNTKNANSHSYSQTTSIHTEGLSHTSTHTSQPYFKWGIWIIAIGSVVLGVFAVSTLFTNATLTITPHSEEHDVSIDFTATNSPSNETQLSFEVFTHTENEQKTIPATNTVHMTRSASGTITVYNNYTEKPMTLVDNTRFKASSNNRIYRATDRFTIPGKTEDAPGSKQITVVADEPGEEYDISGSDSFTVPGLQGDESFDFVYAETTNGIHGGIQGEQKIVKESVQKELAFELEERVQNNIHSTISSQSFSNTIIYTSTGLIEFDPLTQIDHTEETVTYELSGTFIAPLFSKHELSAHIIKDLFSTNQNTETVSIQNLSDLQIRLHEPFSKQAESISGTIDGKADIEWNIQTDDIKQEIAGSAKDDINTILSAHNEVKEARATIQPFWLTHFPEQPDLITIIVASSSPSKTTQSAENE